MQMKPSPRWTGFIRSAWPTYLTLFIFGLFGMAAILYLTEIAPWAYSDSTAYLAVARNIAAGRGIVIQAPSGGFEPYIWHPPLFPLALSLPVALGADILQAVRWLNALLFGLTVFLAGWATWQFSRSFWVSCGAAGLILASFDPLVAFSGVMSEGMFLCWSLLSLAWLGLACQSPQRQNRFLILAGVAAGLAVLTRFSGLAVLAAGALSCLLLVQGRFKRRIQQTLRYLLPGGILAGSWLLPVYFATRTLGSRQMSSTGTFTGKFETYRLAFMDLLGSWIPFYNRGNFILNPSGKLVVGLLLLAILLGISILVIRKRGEPFNRDGIWNWAGILGLFSLANGLLHLVSYLTLIAQPDVNGRLLLPVFLGGALLASALAAHLSRILRKEWIGGLVFTALALLSVWYFHNSVKIYQFEMHHYGQGFTSKRWLENPIFAEISALNPKLPLVSSNPALVLFYTQRFPANYNLSKAQAGASGLILFNDTELGGSREADDFSPPADLYQLLFENNEGRIYLPK